MPLPPDQVPEELSAHEYKRLVALYTLMGRHTEANLALTHLNGLEQATRALTGQADKDEPEVGKANQEFVFTLVRLLKHLAKDEARTEENNQDALSGGFSGPESEVDDDLDPLLAMREQLLISGHSEAECEQYIQNLKKAIKEMTHSEPPPRDVPQDLTAGEYFELGLKYKEVGWTEQARDALTMAIELDGDGEHGQKAQRFLRSKIPRHPVPLKAEQMNIEGYNLMFMKDEGGARKTFETLIREYPDFEWPYGNLGSLLIRQGDLAKAEDLLQHALKINAYYINGWLHLTRVYGVQERFVEAYDCLSRVRAIDPNDASMNGIKELIDQLKDDQFN